MSQLSHQAEWGRAQVLRGVETNPPWLLGLFGEPGHALLIVHGYDDAQWQQAEARLARLFPEAEIRRDVEDPVLPGTRINQEVR